MREMRSLLLMILFLSEELLKLAKASRSSYLKQWSFELEGTNLEVIAIQSEIMIFLST